MVKDAENMASVERRKTRKCKAEGCTNRFVPYASLQTWCSGDCGVILATKKLLKQKRQAEVKERRADKEKLAQFKTIAQLIAAAQIPFNLFIRLRDKDKGCFVCGRPFAPVPGQVQHAGHVRSRGAAGHLRFSEDNCHGECEGCNGPHGAKPHQIKAGAIARIGRERFDALEADNQPHKWTREELAAVKAHYTAEAKKLKAKA